MPISNKSHVNTYSAQSIKTTSNNKVVDASESLLIYVHNLPEYSCKSSSVRVSWMNFLTKPFTGHKR